MNEIKVVVTYEKPNTNKFDALLTEYEAAKKMADETVEYYKPLADVAEEVKFDAIMEQLETIKEYAKKISAINNDKTVYISAHIPSMVCGSIGSDGQEFHVVYRPQNTVTDKFEIRSKHRLFNKGSIAYHSKKSENFIGKWDEWQVYKKLEESACRQLREAIQKQVKRGQEQIDRLSNIQREEC